MTMAKFIYNPLKPTYRATSAGSTGPDEGQVKAGRCRRDGPCDERFVNWNEHVSGANGGRVSFRSTPFEGREAQGRRRRRAPPRRDPDPAVEET